MSQVSLPNKKKAAQHYFNTQQKKEEESVEGDAPTTPTPHVRADNIVGHVTSQYLKIEAAVEQLASPVEPKVHSFKMREPEMAQILVDELAAVPRNLALSPLSMHENFKECLQKWHELGALLTQDI